MCSCPARLIQKRAVSEGKRCFEKQAKKAVSDCGKWLADPVGFWLERNNLKYRTSWHSREILLYSLAKNISSPRTISHTRFSLHFWNYFIEPTPNEYHQFQNLRRASFLLSQAKTMTSKDPNLFSMDDEYVNIWYSAYSLVTDITILKLSLI
jgi:hypothetical protein